MSRRKFLVLLPTYNERENLPRIALRALAASADVDVLVIDDSSPDGTADLARELAEKEPRLAVIQRPGKLGLGSAYILGFVHAMTNGYAGVCTMDADNSHDPAVLPQMFDALKHADLVIGSRYVHGGSTDQPLVRRVNSNVANQIARTMLDLDVTDCTSGFRLYSTDILGTFRLDELRSKGYSMLVELLCKVVEHGGSVAEVPISFCNRREGQSKIGLHEIWESLRTIARLRRGRFGNIRTKVANAIYRVLTLNKEE